MRLTELPDTHSAVTESALAVVRFFDRLDRLDRLDRSSASGTERPLQVLAVSTRPQLSSAHAVRVRRASRSSPKASFRSSTSR
ncbi:hypothetical protein AAFP35_11650 [Gordonia sp. CPCC 206044]|uniref:hypothetical protein n=1 Tax=Gordonia sp. CPCC 206044 TaxID=3140793 RepID=UPI003AF357C3